MNLRSTLVVFARHPTPGAAKTRLIPSLGPAGAAELAHAMLVATLRRLERLNGPARVLAVTPDDQSQAPLVPALGNWLRWPQGDGDLGDRLLRAAQRVAVELRTPTLFLGTDSPDLPLDLIAQADAALNDCEAAVVPSTDGGYCLLAITQPHAALFRNIDWGTSHVLAQTRRAAIRAGLKLAEARPWFDVDTPQDVHELALRAATSADPACRQLRQALLSIKLPPEVERPVAETPAPARVLLADDNPQILELLEAYLEPLGLELLRARDGGETLEMVASQRPDLILLDVMMPRFSGFDICRRIKDDPRTQDIHIIMVTALNEVGDMERAKECGADGYLCKPVNKLELLEFVRRGLERRSSSNR